MNASENQLILLVFESMLNVGSNIVLKLGTRLIYTSISYVSPVALLPDVDLLHGQNPPLAGRAFTLNLGTITAQLNVVAGFYNDVDVVIPAFLAHSLLLKGQILFFDRCNPGLS